MSDGENKVFMEQFLQNWINKIKRIWFHRPDPKKRKKLITETRFTKEAISFCAPDPFQASIIFQDRKIQFTT